MANDSTPHPFDLIWCDQMTRRAKLRRMEQRQEAAKKEEVPEDAAFEAEVARQWEEIMKKVEGGSTSVVPRTLHWKTAFVPVKAANYFHLPVVVFEAGSTLSYRFGTDEFDINFEVRFYNAAGEITTLVPLTRVQSNMEPVCNTHVIETEGTVVLMFDNTYSWLTDKKLSYSVTLTRPGEENSEKARIDRAHEALIAQGARRADAEAAAVALRRREEDVAKEVVELERLVKLAQLNLEKKQAEAESVAAERETAERSLRMYTKHVNGLSIRTLSSDAMAKVFSFAGPDLFSWSVVNKQWNRTAVEALERAMTPADSS